MADKLSKDQLLDNIVADYTRQTRKGNAPQISNYKQKHPQFADEIDDLLTSVAMIEGLKSDDSQKRTGDTTAADLSHLKQIGDYVIIREVGRGGMGVVFEAVHQSLGRRVAIKVMLEREPESEKNIARFRREAQAAAQLHHTNIVSVFGVGEFDGYHYYVMEYIDGISLKSAVRSLTQGDALDSTLERRPATDTEENQQHPSTVGSGVTAEPTLSDSEIGNAPAGNASTGINSKNSQHRHQWVARIGAQIADALGYSHDNGILHRDIKPANLMLDHKEHVWITDFGLVKLTGEDGITKTGAVIGTPQYLAPESLRGEYDQRSETYCLGLTLYELATLTPAFEPGSHAEVFNRIIHEKPQPPAKADPSIPRDLATIIQKAINTEPQQRYESAQALRDDLRAFLDDRPISARRPSLIEQGWRWYRKNPMVASLAVLSSLLVCAIAIVASSAWAVTEVERRKAETARETAETSLKRSQANVNLMVESFDGLYATFLQKSTQGAYRKLDLDGFNELAGIEIAVDQSDANYLKTMASFYERFARENTENRLLLGNAAKGWRRVANIDFLIGDTENAIVAYEKAIDVYHEIQEQNPDSIEALLNLVDTRSELGHAIRQDKPSRERNLKPSMLIAKNLQAIEQHPQADSEQLRFAMAKTLSTIASAEVSRLATESVIDFDKPNLDHRPFLQRTFDALYDKKAKQYVERAVEIATQLVNDKPDNLKYQTLLAKSHCSLGALEANFGDTELANKSLQVAAEKFELLSKEHPENLEFQYQLAITLLLLPSDESRREARLKISDVKKIADELAEKSPNPIYRQLKVASRLKMADLRMSSHQPKLALEQFHEAVDLLIAAELDGPALHSMIREVFETLRIVSRRMSSRDRNDFFFAISGKLHPEIRRSRPKQGRSRVFRR